MGFQTRCPSCGLDFTLPDNMHGKRVRCKQCGEVFAPDGAAGQSVQEAEAAAGPPGPLGARRDEGRDRPRRRPRDEDEDDLDDRPRRSGGQSSGVKIALIIGGILSGTLLLMFFGCLGFCFMLPWKVTPNTAPIIVRGGNPPPAAPPVVPPNPGPRVETPPVPPQAPQPKPEEPKTAEPKVVSISAGRLGQELFDDSAKTMERFVPCVLQVHGVVRKQSVGGDGSVTEVIFLQPVTDKKTSAAKEYTIWCRFATPLAPGSRAAEQAAVGRLVTVRGRITGAGVGPPDPQATLNECVLVGAADAGKPSPAPGKPPSPATHAPPPVRWRVHADPLPAGLTLPEHAEGKIPITGYPKLPNNVVDEVVLPSSPSPFATVAVKGRIQDAHEVWDLRSMKRVGLVDTNDPFSDAALSPDGAYFAVPIFQLKHPGGAEVYAVADGKRVATIHVTQGSEWFNNVDFAGPGELVTFQPRLEPGDAFDATVQVWDVKTGKELRHLRAAADLDRKRRAFSPGRRYLALPASKVERILLYDLTTADLAGELPLPAGAKTRGLAFSLDSKQLAGLLEVDGTNRLLAWNLDAGTASANFTLGSEAVPKVSVYQGPVLDWMPDGGGWVVFGRRIVDGRSGAYYWPIPAEDRDWTPRRIFPDARLAYVGDERGKRFLFIVPLEKDKMEEALKRVRAGR